MKTHLIRLSIFIAILFFGLVGMNRALALSSADITFPVAELGGCIDKSACMKFCDAPENQPICQDFATKYGLNKNGEKEREGKIQKNGGPGNCAENAKDSEEACRSFCNRQENITICVDWAEKNVFLKGRELEEAKKVRDALKRGAKLPEACTDMQACDKVCKNPKTIADAKSCFRFAKEAGFASQDVSEEKIEKMFTALQSSQSNNGPFKNFDDFGKCEKPESEAVLQQCIKFATDNNLLSDEEKNTLEQTGGKGPGGCQGEECRNFCNKDENMDTCRKFSEEHGLMRQGDNRPEESRPMNNGEFKNGEMNSGERNRPPMPPEVEACLGPNFKQNIKGRPTKEQEAKMRECFDKTMREQKGEDHPNMSGKMNNPGMENKMQNRPEPSCKGPEECKVFYEQYLDKKREVINQMQDPKNYPEGEKRKMPEAIQPNMKPGEFQRPDQKMTPEMMDKMRREYNQNPNMTPNMERKEMPPPHENMPPPRQEMRSAPPASSPPVFPGAPTSKANKNFFQDLFANILSIFFPY